MLWHQIFDGFQLHDNLLFHEKVSEIISKGRSIFVKDVEWALLDGLKTLFTKPVCQCVFVYFFKVAIAEVVVDTKSSFTDQISKLKYWVFLHYVFFCAFCAFLRLTQIYRSHSPMTKSNEPRMTTMSDMRWPGRILGRMLRLQKEGLLIFRRWGTPPPVLLM